MRSLQFIQTIGAGAFGTVYLCRMSTLQGFEKRVALKVLHSQANAGMFLSRIRDEARLLGLLQDSAIIKVMDLLEVQDRQAVLMEYVEGADLETIVEEQGCPPPRAIAEIAAVVAGALSRAHMATHPTTGEALNVIHRDVKPANIMVSREGAVKLLDFGVARACFDARESFTGQLVLGTLNYMAPEYVVTGEVTPAADVYGLGLALWQSATGRVYGQPKVRRKDHEQRLQERTSELPPAHRGLADVLRSMLAWNPQDRPTAAQAEEALDDIQRHLPGPGLRSWARETIPPMLLEQRSVPDEAQLLGTRHQLEEGLDPTDSVGAMAEVPGSRPTHDSLNIQPVEEEDTQRISAVVLTEPTRPSTGPTRPSTGPTRPSTGPTRPSTGPTLPDSVDTEPEPATEEIELTESTEVTEAAPRPPAPPQPPSPPPSPSPSPRPSGPLTVPVVKGLLIGGGLGLIVLAIVAAVVLGIQS